MPIAAGHQPGHRPGRSTASRRASRRSGCRPPGSPATSAIAPLAAGYTVVDPTTALSTHLSETIRTFLPDLLTRQHTKEMIDRVGQTVAEAGRGAGAEDRRRLATSSACCGSCCASVCRFATSPRILEALADVAPLTKDPDAGGRGGARARSAVRSAGPTRPTRATCRRCCCRPALEERLLGSLVKTEHGAVLALDPTQAQRWPAASPKVFASAMAQPVLMCSPMLRPHLWRLFARVLPHLGVLSHNEVPPQVHVAAVATLD
jgi:flagellar biosynthesis protein FlhA